MNLYNKEQLDSDNYGATIDSGNLPQEYRVTPGLFRHYAFMTGVWPQDRRMPMLSYGSLHKA
jgi:hypothetical protein